MMKDISNDVSGLDFTGERYLPEVRGNIELEHLHRYLLAKQAVVGKTVLDIASGEGYGSAMLAESAHRVTGVDISQEAVSHAQAKYRAENLEFRLGSCSAIPLGDASVDVVVSFETIEHHDEHEAMMREIKRVLRPGGVMIISSPDKLEYSDKPGYSNPYHIQELYRDEFRKLLDLYFKNHSIYGQRVIYGSAIFLENGISTVESYELSSNALSTIAGVPYPVYLIAVASDAEVPVLGSGILEQPINETDLVKGWTGAVAERDVQIANLNRVIAGRDNQIGNLNQAIAGRDNQIGNLNQAVFEAKARLIAIENSTLWKMTFPLRRTFGGAPTLRKICRRTVKLVWWGGTLQLGRKLRDWKARDETAVERPHFAPPIGDFCLALPLNYPASQWKSPPDIAVVLHMYYLEMAEEFQRYLTNIPFPFDLFITTDSQEKQLAIENCFSDWNRGKIEVRIAPNRGRDIAPKLITCRDIYGNYEFILHVHTKKSPHDDVLKSWRFYLLETLLGSKKIVEGIFESFASDPRLGIVAPQHFEPVRPFIGWGWNFNNAREFARRLSVRLSPNGRLDFPSGSMFWARSAALKPLLDCDLTLDEFPTERGQIDGTLGHIIERLYFFVCERAGYRWIKICQPSLLRQTERIMYVEDQKELVNFIKDTQYKVLKSRIEQFLSSVLAKQKDYPIRTGREVDLLVHEKSPYKAMDFSQFQHELTLHIEKKESLIDFDETFYLDVNDDIAESIANGTFSCGFAHYCLIGKKEGRIWSDYQLRRKFSLSPNFPKGFNAPVHIGPLPKPNLDLSHLPRSPEPFLLIFFSHLQEDLFFAGYTEFFRDFGPIFKKFSKIVLSVESDNHNPELATRYSPRIEVIHEGKLDALKYGPDLVVAFNSQLFIRATRILSDLNKIIYYCQDFESGFFPYGDEYIQAEKAIARSHNVIISTDLLKRFLADRQLLSQQRIFTTSPKIKPFDVPPQKTKRLFFYFRPEFFHRRNLPQTLMEAVVNFCQSHRGYEIYMIGTVDTRYSYKINGTSVFILNKLPAADYIQLISSADVVISMIYSAHPGVIAFQAAASGIPTITNVFENRNARLLKQLSENIVPYDPVREDLLKLIEMAISMPKGKKSFNEALYAGTQTQSLADFIDTILFDELDRRQAIAT